MKNLYGWISLFLSLCLLLFPLIPGRKAEAVAVVGTEVKSDAVTFRFKEKDSEEIREISAEEYLLGVVSAEMPASFHLEALKAQAVAAYTFALWRKNENKNEKYDITGDSTLDQAFINEEGRRKKWGDKCEEYTDKIKSAINSVLGQTVTYNGKIAQTLYTAISGGKTEAAENVWSKGYPYLVPVESVGDLLSPNYLSTATFSSEEIIKKLPEIEKVKVESWFSSPVYSDSGTVMTMKFGSVSLTGKQIRYALGLKSANFDVSAKNDTFTFTVRGYGHGVGMSQYGADYMAKQGSSYKEILEWYYKGCKVV